MAHKKSNTLNSNLPFLIHLLFIKISILRMNIRDRDFRCDEHSERTYRIYMYMYVYI